MERRGLYAHIRRNQVKSVALLIGGITLYAGMALVLLALTTAALNAPLVADHLANAGQATPRGNVQAMDIIRDALRPDKLLPMTWLFLVAVLVAVGHSLHAQWKASGVLPGRIISRAEMPWLFNMVENMAIQLGLTAPAIRIVDSDRLAAFAHGLSAHRSTIVMTRGLLQALTPEEVEAVAAHEMTHIRNQDTRFLTIARAFFDTIGVRVFLNRWNDPQERLTMAASLLLLFGGLWFIGTPRPVLLASMIALAVFMAVILFASRVLVPNEFVADAGAVEITRNPLALASALCKIAGRSSLPMTDRIIAAMMISGPSEGFLATHPPLERRIAAIVRHGGVLLHEYRHHAMGDHAAPAGHRQSLFGTADSTASAMPGSRPLFGRREAPSAVSARQREDELKAWQKEQTRTMQSLAEILERKKMQQTSDDYILPGIVITVLTFLLAGDLFV